MRFIIIVVSIFLFGCESHAVLKAGGYKMIHMNNPECMGLSAAGVVIVNQSEDVITTDITQKNGYCESLSGQVITSGAKVLQGRQIGNGLSDSGSVTNTTAVGNESIPIQTNPSDQGGVAGPQ